MKSIIISGICGKMGEMVYQSAKEYGIKTVCGVDKLSYDNFDCLFTIVLNPSVNVRTSL